MRTTTETTNKFTIRSGGYLCKSGSVAVNKAFNIGVKINGDNTDVFIKYIGCEVKIVEGVAYYGDGKPTVIINWRTTYLNMNRSTREWGKRDQYDGIDNDYVETILGSRDERIALEDELLYALETQLQEGLQAIGRKWFDLGSKE
jgi:hypothetical protein